MASCSHLTQFTKDGLSTYRKICAWFIAGSSKKTRRAKVRDAYGVFYASSFHPQEFKALIFTFLMCFFRLQENVTSVGRRQIAFMPVCAVFILVVIPV